MLNYVVLGLIGAIVALMVWVRLAPSDAAFWHGADMPVGAAGEFSTEGSYTVLREVSDARASLEAMDAIITQTPRTRRLAGSVEEGRMTYVTRSRVMGFPDYTTVMASPPDAAAGRASATLAIYGRLRFGRSDLGVNRARIQAWLAQLDGAAS